MGPYLAFYHDSKNPDADGHLSPVEFAGHGDYSQVFDPDLRLHFAGFYLFQLSLCSRITTPLTSA